MKRPLLTHTLPVGALLFLLLFVAGALAARPARQTVEEPPFPHRIYLPVMPVPRRFFDMADFIVGDGRLYEVWHSNDSQARHQTQFEGQRFYHTKGEPVAEWEELWIDGQFVYRGTDTSPGAGLYYTLRDGGQYGSKWSPRIWDIGDIYERHPWVTFYNKSGCGVDSEFPQNTWLRFEAYYDEYTFDDGSPAGITLENVIELAWLLDPDGQPEERYFYARNFGLVGWTNNHGDFSRISEIHAPGTRPDNSRELIPCLDTGARPIPDLPIWPARPYEPPYRAK